MNQLFANSGEPWAIEPILYGSGYPPGQVSIETLGCLLALYAVSAGTIVAITGLTFRLTGRPASHHWSELMLFLIPCATWLLAIYSDSGHKGAGNIYELAALGAIVGIVIGLNRGITHSWLNGVTATWVLCVVSLGLYMFVPAVPPNGLRSL